MKKEHKQLKTVYLAGPVSGMKDDNKPLFQKMSRWLEREGYRVLCSAELPPGMVEEHYMDICFAMIRASDLLWILPGWEESEGTQAEYFYARKRKIPIQFFTDQDCAA